MNGQFVLMEEKGKYAILRLNRPEVRNALNNELMEELARHLKTVEESEHLHCAILTGHEKFFVGGADIAMMKPLTHIDAFTSDFVSHTYNPIMAFRKPLIAAVAGYALGGGCELALMCDIIISADNAVFAQPEVNLGIMPGAGGSQRLAKSVGKAKTMDMCLTARMVDAHEAEKIGLVSRVVAADQVMAEAEKVAEKLCSLSLPALIKIKTAVNQAYETPLSAGLTVERQLFYSCFGTDDQKEGMSAFLEKRPSEFKNR